MRTTMNLPDALMAQVKQRASSEGRTVTSLVEQALRELLNRGARPMPTTTLPSWSLGAPLVDLDDRALLHELAYGDDPEKYRS